MTLPKSVIKKDHDLEQDYEAIGSELMELRWHWTLDESNPKRVPIREYAREVGRAESGIRADANGWAASIAANAAHGDVRSETPGQARTPNDFRELAKLGAEKQYAAEAIAKVSGKSAGNVARAKREELTAVVNRARERAERKGRAGTEAVIEEIDTVVEWDAKAAATRARVREQDKKRHTSRYIEIEGDLGVAMQRLRKVLNVAEGVGFTEEEIELMTVSLGKLRALMNLIDLRIAGETNIDWDAEFQKIER